MNNLKGYEINVGNTLCRPLGSSMEARRQSVEVGMKLAARGEENRPPFRRVIWARGAIEMAWWPQLPRKMPANGKVFHVMVSSPATTPTGAAANCESVSVQRSRARWTLDGISFTVRGVGSCGPWEARPLSFVS